MVETECGALYTGITTDVERRFQEHLNDKKKGAKFFRAKKAKALVFQQGCRNRSEASQLEAKVKKYSAQQKRQLIIQQ